MTCCNRWQGILGLLMYPLLFGCGADSGKLTATQGESKKAGDSQFSAQLVVTLPKQQVTSGNLMRGVLSHLSLTAPLGISASDYSYKGVGYTFSKKGGFVYSEDIELKSDVVQVTPDAGKIIIALNPTLAMQRDLIIGIQVIDASGVRIPLGLPEQTGDARKEVDFNNRTQVAKEILWVKHRGTVIAADLKRVEKVAKGLNIAGALKIAASAITVLGKNKEIDLSEGDFASFKMLGEDQINKYNDLSTYVKALSFASTGFLLDEFKEKSNTLKDPHFLASYQSEFKTEMSYAREKSFYDSFGEEYRDYYTNSDSGLLKEVNDSFFAQYNAEKLPEVSTLVVKLQGQFSYDKAAYADFMGQHDAAFKQSFEGEFIATFEVKFAQVGFEAYKQETKAWTATGFASTLDAQGITATRLCEGTAVKIENLSQDERRTLLGVDQGMYVYTAVEGGFPRTGSLQVYDVTGVPLPYVKTEALPAGHVGVYNNYGWPFEIIALSSLNLSSKCSSSTTSSTAATTTAAATSTATSAATPTPTPATTTAKASLSISDGPTYNFGNILTLGLGRKEKTVTVTNSGSASATALVASGVSAPFSFKGGTYPGTGGTCGTTLAASGSCSLQLLFSNSSVGSSSATLTMTYHDGASAGKIASLAISGTGVAPLWTWVSGSSSGDQLGDYGTKGVAASSNVPGSRYSSVSWKDASGNLWLFGGSKAGTAHFNDLWKYDGTNWTWVSGSSSTGEAGTYGTKGVAASSNVPGIRDDAATWIDGSGNLWLFGGNNGSGNLNDLWKYDGTNWTWVSGSDSTAQLGTYGTKGVAASSNVPGARSGSVSWKDGSGNLWLFGGANGELNLFNDLWKFDGTNWTWVSGSSVVGQTGTYGTKGVAASSNVPGARFDAVSWIDSSGNLWLFGGNDVDLSNVNDLWKFDGTNWTWVSGSSSGGQAGTYGTQGVAASGNIPGARLDAVSWIDGSGNFWLFGGNTLSSGAGSRFNDLWKYDGTNWTWVSGSSSASQEGTYGTKGVAASSNVPGSRYESVSWIDASGNLWLFGGLNGALNDLWKFGL